MKKETAETINISMLYVSELLQKGSLRQRKHSNMRDSLFVFHFNLVGSWLDLCPQFICFSFFSSIIFSLNKKKSIIRCYILLQVYHLVSQTKALLQLDPFFALPCVASNFNISTKFRFVVGFDSCISSNLCNQTEFNTQLIIGS